MQPHNAAKARIGVVIHNRDRQPALYYAIITLEPLKKPSEEFMAWWLTLPGAYGFHSTLPMVAQIETGNSAEEVRRDARKSSQKRATVSDASSPSTKRHSSPTLRRGTTHFRQNGKRPHRAGG